MAVKESLIERVLTESAIELGKVERIQAFAASMMVIYFSIAAVILGGTLL